MSQLQRIFKYQNNQVRTIIKNDEPWFVAKDVEQLDDIPQSPSVYCGYVYAIELGQCIKIGYTNNPKVRIKALISQAKNYSGIPIGLICISQPHTNFQANEKELHKHFAAERKGSGELFRIDIVHFLDRLPELTFLDQSKEREQRAESAVEFFKAIVTGGI